MTTSSIIVLVSREIGAPGAIPTCDLSLRDYFGSCRVRLITHGDVCQFRAARLAQETRTNTQRTIASVNHELSMLRRMLNVAQREGWILRNPFAAGDSLITQPTRTSANEFSRTKRKLNYSSLQNSTAQALMAILICALDTGMRQGEIFSLRWRDVYLENGLLACIGAGTIESQHTEQ